MNVTINTIFLFLLLLNFHWASFSRHIFPKHKGERERRLIVGGYYATVGEHPSAASLQKMDTSGHFKHICTFSLITTRSLLGAAHCVTTGPNHTLDKVEYYVGHLGDLDHRKNTYRVFFSEFRVHPQYDGDFYFNDIGILVLTEQVRTGLNIGTILLVGARYTIIGYRARMYGWGSINNSSRPEPSIFLRHVDLDIVSNLECEKHFGFLNDYELCAGSKGKGGCDGDAGAPLIAWHGSKEVELAMMTHASETCAENPSIVLNVYYFKDWIKSNAAGTPEFYG